MPIYEYVCQACGERFEVLRQLDQDAADLKCPACGSQRLEKAVSAPAPAAVGKKPSGFGGGCGCCGGSCGF